MNHRFFLGAYWPARQESIDQCADRLLSFFSELAECDEVFSSWRETGWSRKQAVEKTAEVSNREYLLKRLDRGRNRRDIGHEIIEELGFSVHFWNGREKGKAVGLHVNCGLHWISPAPNASLGNCVTLDLPEDLGELRQTERTVRVLAAAARAWEPDWAGVMSKESMTVRSFDAKVPFVDWMVYIPRKIGGVSPPSRVIGLEDIGSIIIVHPVPPENGIEEILRIREIEELLK